MRALALAVLLAPAALAQPAPQTVVGFAERGDVVALAAALDAGASAEAPAEIEGVFDGPITPLMAAARQDRADAVALLLRAGAAVDATDGKGNTALRWAADGHAADAARRLLDAGADADHPNAEGTTPTDWAALRGADAVLALLLDAGAPTDGLLSHAVQTYGERHGGATTVALLLERGAAPNGFGSNGWTPLYRAVDNTPGGLLVTQLLLDAGADRGIPNTGTTPARGKTPTDRAREMGGPIGALYEGVPEAEAQAGLLAAVLRGDADAVAGFVAQGADPNAGTKGSTVYGDEFGTDDGGPLHLAALVGAPAAVVDALVAAGADPNAVSMAGFPPLKVAAERGDLATVRALLAAGASADGGNGRPLMGMEPIHWAAISGRADVVQALLDAGADPGYTTNASMGYGYNALGFAVHYGHADAVRVLLDAGADPSIAGEARATPLDVAEARSWTAIADLLRQRGAQTAAEAARIRIEGLLADGGPEAAWAEAARDPDLIRSLLDHGVPVPASFILDAVFTLVEVPDLVVRLAEAGADVNARDAGGWTALHFAASDGRGPLVVALLAAHADPTLRTSDGETARQLAEGSGDDETLGAFVGR